MSIEVAEREFANRLHKNQVEIVQGGPEGPGNYYRFDAGSGRIMSVQVNCYALSANGPADINVSVHKGKRLLKKQSFCASGCLQGAANLGYGVVLTAGPWTLRKIQRPKLR